MVLGKPDIHMQRNGVGPLTLTIYKKQLKMDYRAKLRMKAIKLLEENEEYIFLTLHVWMIS